MKKAETLLLMLTGWLCATGANAQAPPGAWSIGTFVVPVGSLESTSAPSHGASLEPPPKLPAAEATAEEWAQGIERSSRFVQQVLSAQGIVMSQGSRALYDPASGTLCVYNSAPALELTAQFLDELTAGTPGHAQFVVCLLETGDAEARKALEDARSIADHSGILKRLEKSGNQDRPARRLQEIRLESRSKQSTTGELTWPVEKKATEAGDPEGRPLRMKLALEPLFKPGEPCSDLNYALESSAGSSARSHLAASTTVWDGMTKLVGAWPATDASPAGGGRWHALFVTTHLVHLANEPNALVESRLRAHLNLPAASPAPVPLAKARDAPAPDGEGLVTRAFRVPRDFFAASEYVNRAFAPAPSPFGFLDEPSIQKPALAGGSILPVGTTSSYDASTGILTVTGSPGALDLVQKHLGEVWRLVPRTVSGTFVVVEGDGNVLDPVVTGTTRLADHSAAWRQAEALVRQGRIRMIGQHRLEARSGTLASIRSVPLRESSEDSAMMLGFEPNLTDQPGIMDLSLDVHLAGSQTCSLKTSMVTGTWRMVGIHRRDHAAPDSPARRQIQAVFFRADIIPMDDPRFPAMRTGSSKEPGGD